jgi:hypothetical protein
MKFPTESTHWDGAPLTLAWHDSVTMAQTPNGSAILVYLNEATVPLDAILTVTADGGPPQILQVPSGKAPSILAQNWRGGMLALTNISNDKATPIRIQMFGPGFPGAPPVPLNIGTPVRLPSLHSAQGPGGATELVLQAQATTLTTVAVIGGPADASGNNAYLFALNYQGPPNPPGYTAATSSNTYTYPFNWGSSIFVANLSGELSPPLQVTLRLS